MKTFEMPKMNVAIFSLEDVVTTSVTNIEAAKEQIKAIDATAAAANITVTSATDWINA